MSVLRSAVRSVVRPVRRWILAVSCLLTGHQHPLFTYWWYLSRKSRRDPDFNTRGMRKFQALPAAGWRQFSDAVQAHMEQHGYANQSYVDCAEDKRISIDCSQEPIAGFIRAFCESEGFKSTMNEIYRNRPWKIVYWQIYRTYPEKFGASAKEINSTYYHVDNGGHITDRLLLSVFMYLSDVAHPNGPFTFYTPQQTSRINKHFKQEMFKYGNLRTYDLVSRIEALEKPQELSLEPGEAAVMDNQVCMHRAGFCTAGHRDIFQMHVRG